MEQERNDSYKVVVHGSYFANNFGDTLLIKLMCDKVAKIVGRGNVYLAVDGHPQEQASIGYPVVPKENRHTITHLIFAGGGYFGEPNTTFMNKLKWSYRNYKRHLSWVGDYKNARISVLGVGYGPLSNVVLRHQVNRMMRKADVILLRDRESIAYLGDKRARQCVDLALSLKGKRESKNAVGLHLYGINDEDKVKLIGIFAERYKDRSIYLLNDTGINNYKSEAVQKKIRAVNRSRDKKLLVLAYGGVNELLTAIDQCEVILTTKLHVGITGIAQGVKVISLPIHQKTVRLYRQLGLEQYCIAYQNYTEQKLVHAMDKLENYLPTKQAVSKGLKAFDTALRQVFSN